MPETPPIGTPVYAVVLEPLSATFPAAGKVVILKRIRNGRIHVRSRHPYKHYLSPTPASQSNSLG